MKPALRWSEYQQLELIPANVRRCPSWRDRLWQLWQQSIATVTASEPIQVWLTHDETGTWWNARDRHTGRSIHHTTESELRIWIEQRYLH